MLKKIFTPIIAACLFAGFYSTASAQISFFRPDPEYKNYKWEDTMKMHSLSADELKRNSVVIKDKRILEYYYATQDSLVMYTTRHFIVRVNSDKAIDENNTVYISLSDDVKVIDMEARAITKDGKVTELNKANVKDVPNYDNAGPYRIFAIDGVEKGGEVEYLYTVRHSARIYGTEYIKRLALHKLVDVNIYSPSNLVFQTKSYNGFPDMVLDSNMTSKRHIFAMGHNIEGYDQEEFSGEEGALMRMEYTLAYNKSSNDPEKRLFDYNGLCEIIFQALYKTTSKQDLKIAAKVIDTMKLGNMSDEDKIRRIESRIKTGLLVRDDAPDNPDLALSTVFKNKVCSPIEILKVYKLLFDAAKINHEIVLTSNRFERPFDGDFESRIFLQNYLIYFPSTNNYIAPTEMASRYGFEPNDWICQKGFFMHAITVGKDDYTGVGKVKELPCNDYKQSMGGVYADVKLDLDGGVANLHYKQTYTGYEAAAAAIQPYYTFLGDQDRKDYIDKEFKAIFEDATPTNVKVSGYGENDLYRNPFVIEADFSTNSVLEKAGNKYLFKVGILIGPQSELYHDTVRHTPIENRYNHGYHREITFEIPDGYSVSNLDAINMDVFDSTGNAPHTMEFHSYYKTDGNKVTIYCDEYYSQLRYPINMYEQFRRVINASADFNKVTLFIEKK